MDRFIRFNNDAGLLTFRNTNRLKDLGVWDGVNTGKLDPAALETLKHEQLPATLFLYHDEEQVQICGDNVMTDHMGLTVEGKEDYYHRNPNNVKIAIKQSGLFCTYLCAVCVYNVGFGPWNSSAFFNQVIAHVASLAKKIQPDGQMLHHFWQRILMDRREHYSTDPAITGTVGRQTLIDDMNNTAHDMIHGQRCGIADWWSINKAHKFWDRIYHTQGLILTSYCLDKGMLLAVEDLRAPVKGALIRHIDMESKKSAADAKRWADDKLKAMKDKSKGALHNAARLVEDPDVINGVRIIMLLTEPSWSEWTSAIQTMKGSDGVNGYREWCCQRAKYGVMKMLNETAACTKNSAELERAGFIYDFSTPKAKSLNMDSPETVYQDVLAFSVMSLQIRLIAEHAGTDANNFYSYPARFALMTKHNTESTIQRGYALFKEDVDAWHWCKVASM